MRPEDQRDWYGDDPYAAPEASTEWTPTPVDDPYVGRGRPARGSFNAIPWVIVLMLLLAAGAIALLLLVFKPMLDKSRARAEELEQWVKVLDGERHSLRKENQELTGRLGKLQAEQSELAAAVSQREAEIEQLRAAREELEEKLAGDIESGRVAVRREGNMLAVDLADEVLFSSGEAVLSDDGKKVIWKVCPSLRGLEDRLVEVGGHTDNQRIVGKARDRFPTNWELATARATNVVRFLQDDCSIPGERLVATGFSQFRPVASNRSAKGRAKNRRIELVVRPLPEGAEGE